MSFKSRGGGGAIGGGEASSFRGTVSRKWALLLCLGSFCLGLLFTNSLSPCSQIEREESTNGRSGELRGGNRMWTIPEPKDIIRRTGTEGEKMNLVDGDCSTKSIGQKREHKDVLGEVSRTHHAIQTLDKTISNLEMELAAARATQESILSGSPLSENVDTLESTGKQKFFMVVGINTAFSSRKRRDSVRATWLPQGEKRKKLEEEKGIIIRFVIGHSATPGGILDKAIEAEGRKHGDFMRLVKFSLGYLQY
ncbi:putative beta-1,3-galactosyltransferase 2 [Ananas comosus]|uniref:Hexosyltransferase n=1 Tax=Ananas comosus TaxID=4615 RepID=A0A199VIS6_ANACO|nr:putative beta-1,3-galactosyltransferase 2 [Ananas comosus]